MQEWYDRECQADRAEASASMEGYVFEEDERAENGGDLMSLGWRSDAERWEDKLWVKAKSVVDSGCSTPVAPPTMAPNVPIVPSAASRAGVKYNTAAKTQLKNLGQQHIKACTESGSMTKVLFQIAEVTKPLVSVSAICERGSRVTFGKSGGVVQNLKTGAETPFYKENGIYVLTMWLQDEEGELVYRP